MLRITITKSPAVRLFDRMPMPKAAKVRNLVIARRSLTRFQNTPFQRKVTRIA